MISAHIQLSGCKACDLKKSFTHCGGNGLRVPPVPIPNTEVKPQHADGTWLETARESRSLPHSHSRSAFAGRAFLCLNACLRSGMQACVFIFAKLRKGSGAKDTEKIRSFSCDGSAHSALFYFVKLRKRQGRLDQ